MLSDHLKFRLVYRNVKTKEVIFKFYTFNEILKGINVCINGYNLINKDVFTGKIDLEKEKTFMRMIVKMFMLLLMYLIIEKVKILEWVLGGTYREETLKVIIC